MQNNCVIWVKSDITYIFSHNYAIIENDWYDSLPLEKTVTLHNVNILIKSFLNKDQNQSNIFHYWSFLDKGFKIQPDICNGWHHVLMMSMKLNNNAIINVNGADYDCTKGKSVNLD